jgi:hypothetical protein
MQLKHTMNYIILDLIVGIKLRLGSAAAAVSAQPVLCYDGARTLLQ